MAEKYVSVSELRKLLGIPSGGQCTGCQFSTLHGCKDDSLRRACEAIDDAPEADVRPVVRGKWEIADSYAGPGLINLRCSVCGAFGGTWKDNTIPSMLPKFCHECGSDMRKVKSDD